MLWELFVWACAIVVELKEQGSCVEERVVCDDVQ